MMANKGEYVVIEGNDGTGKSTQVELLSEWLNNEHDIETYVVHEPAGTPTADAIREVIKNGALERDAYTNLLLFTASRHEIWSRSKQELSLGKWVLSARNYISTEVYQGFAEGLPVQLIHDITSKFTDDQYMNPDHTFVLTLTDNERRRRIESRGPLQNPDTFESRGGEFQARLNDGYLQAATEYGFETIDADQSIESIQTYIRSAVMKGRQRLGGH